MTGIESLDAVNREPDLCLDPLLYLQDRVSRRLIGAWRPGAVMNTVLEDAGRACGEPDSKLGVLASTIHRCAASSAHSVPPVTSQSNDQAS